LVSQDNYFFTKDINMYTFFSEHQNLRHQKVSIDISNCPSPHSWRNKLGRVLWSIVWLCAYRPSPRFLHGWRRLLLRLFGAKLGKGVHPYPSAKIWAPWNLEMGDYSCLGQNVDCYCVDRILIGSHSTVSQYSYLCTASHDYTQPEMSLVTSPIVIGQGVWIAADVFVGPGVIIGDSVVIGARSSVFEDVAALTVVTGNPAKPIKKRELKVNVYS
jgi:putative colanic acid biosynthesis acetyltransferase WcaF